MLTRQSPLMFRVFFVVLCFFASIVVAAAAGQSQPSPKWHTDLDELLSEEEKQWILNNPVIQVAAVADWPPFEYLEQGDYKGLHADILRLVAKKAGLDINPVFDNWEVQETRLAKGERQAGRRGGQGLVPHHHGCGHAGDGWPGGY